MKQILQNQKGMSLIEVTVAAAISVVISMGVMRINENANKGMRTIQDKSDYHTFQNTVKGHLMSGEKCMASSFATHNWGSTNGSSAPAAPNAESDYFGWSTAGNSFTLGVTTAGATETFTVGQLVPFSNSWKLKEYRFYDEGATGTCTIMLLVEKSNANSYGGDEKILWLPLTCEVNGGGTLDSCSSSTTVMAGVFIDDDSDGSFETDKPLHIESPGSLQVGGAAGTYKMSGTASLDVMGNGAASDWMLSGVPAPVAPAVGTLNHAIAVPGQHVISFGTPTVDQVGLWTENNSGMLQTNGRFLAFGLRATQGNISTLVGGITSAATVTAGTGITATTGDITATTGDITATTGDITATAGSISAGPIVTVPVAGDMVARGNLYVETGAVEIMAGSLRVWSGGVKSVGLIETDGNVLAAAGGVQGQTLELTAGGVLSSDGTTISFTHPTSAPEVRGPQHYANVYNVISDGRYKKEIKTLKRATEKLSELRGVTYFMRKDEFPDKGFNDRKQIGLIAQEVELVFPEVVTTDEDGFKSVQYMNLVPVLIEAFKEQLADIKKNNEMFKTMSEGVLKKNQEQDKRIVNLEKENRKLRVELDELKVELNQINEKLNKMIMRK